MLEAVETSPTSLISIHVRIWEAEFGERLVCQREIGNPHDIFAVAVLKEGVAVGHIPKTRN